MKILLILRIRFDDKRFKKLLKHEQALKKIKEKNNILYGMSILDYLLIVYFLDSSRRDKYLIQSH